MCFKKIIKKLENKNIISYRLFIGMLMYISFIFLAFNIYAHDFFSMFFNISAIIVAYICIVYFLNPMIEKHGNMRMGEINKIKENTKHDK